MPTAAENLRSYTPKKRIVAKTYVQRNLAVIQTTLRKGASFEEVFNLIMKGDDKPEKMTLHTFTTYFYRLGGRKTEPTAPGGVAPGVAVLPIPKR